MNSKKIKNSILFGLSTVFFYALIPSVVKSDFGSADVTGFGANEVSSFDAWCGASGNDCFIEFKKDRIIIDRVNVVKKKQIKDFKFSVRERKCAITLITGNNCALPVQKSRTIIDIEYIKNNGFDGSARVLFSNNNTGRRFIESLSLLTGIPLS